MSYNVNLATSNGGLEWSGNSIAMASCTATGEILKWNQKSQKWSCATGRNMLSHTGAAFREWSWQIFRDDSSTTSDFVTATYDTGLNSTCHVYAVQPDGSAFYCNGAIKLPSIESNNFPGFHADNRIVLQVTAIDPDNIFQYTADGGYLGLDPYELTPDPDNLQIGISGFSNQTGWFVNGQYRTVRAVVTLTGRVNKPNPNAPPNYGW